jgi:signal peptidase II
VPGGKRKTIIGYLTPVILILDQLTKYIVCRNLSPGQSIPIIKNVFHLTYILNRGGAFGIFKGHIYLFILIAAVAIIFILINLRRVKIPRIKIALALILSGATSNLIDRLRLNAVIDFLDFRIWPVFNVADSAITIGTILLAYSMLFKKVKGER